MPWCTQGEEAEGAEEEADWACAEVACSAAAGAAEDLAVDEGLVTEGVAGVDSGAAAEAGADTEHQRSIKFHSCLQTVCLVCRLQACKHGQRQQLVPHAGLDLLIECFSREQTLDNVLFMRLETSGRVPP